MKILYLLMFIIEASIVIYHLVKMRPVYHIENPEDNEGWLDMAIIFINTALALMWFILFLK